MVHASLPVSVDAIHPSAVYQGRVYTQDAVVSLGEGPSFDIYDDHLELSEAHVGTTQAVEVMIRFAAIRPSSTDVQAVEFDAEDQPVFRGRVTDRDRSAERDVAKLAVGVGGVLFYPDEADFEVSVGDSIRISRTVRHLRQRW